MATTTRKNATVKALQSYLNAQRKSAVLSAEVREQYLFEYIISCSTDNELVPHDLQQYLRDRYDRRGQHRGATKATHTRCHRGWEFHDIVIKRIRINACIELGHQGKFEARTWEHFATSPEADMLCPVLRWFGSKSDKVLENSEKDRENFVMICQRAVDTGTAREMCVEAERRNREEGFKGESANRRLAKLEALANQQGWWDVLRNGGNSGVIFDHSQNCYKAVFIDYAL